MKISRLYFTIILGLFLITASLNSHAGNQYIDTGMKLFKNMEMNKAATHLIKNIEETRNLTSIEKLKYALILNKNIAMYRDIYIKSLDTQKIFLETLISSKNSDESKLAPLFLSEVYILKKEYKKATTQLSLFEKNKPSDQLISDIAEITRIWVEQKIEKKNDLNRFSNHKSPLFLMALDAIQIMVYGKSTIDLSILDEAKKEYIKNNKILSRFANYALRIYSFRGELEKAKSIITSLDQKSPSHIEVITQFKLINFYEPSLISSVSFYYYQLSKSILTDLKHDTKFHDMAVYYLSDLELIMANTKSAKQYKEEMLTIKRLPKSISSLVPIRQNGHGYMYGKTTRAYQAWAKAVNNAKNNPAIGAEAILMCVYLNASCPTIVQTARLKAENGRSKRFENINTNIGRYFLLKKENGKALRLLENALDRGKADGILMNDPMLLLNLAEIYRLNKQFSESLQIYFSLGQNFPILRQVQDAVQGEYLFRQRSTGRSTVF